MVSPELVAWYTPAGAADLTRATIRSATSIVHVGCPYWSSTTSTSGRCRSSLIIVRTKFGPCAPYSQAVRTT